MEFVEVVDIDNRTVDISEGVKAKDFASMLISQPIVDGLINAGFVCPSPVQLRAIPVGQLGLGTYIIIVRARFRIENPESGIRFFRKTQP
jgi:superfamily II DNA/RNA helicase